MYSIDSKHTYMYIHVCTCTCLLCLGISTVLLICGEYGYSKLLHIWRMFCKFTFDATHHSNPERTALASCFTENCF